MGLVSFVFCTIGRCIDILCFMLDLNFCVVNSLVRLLVSLITFLNNLPALLLRSLEQCWSHVVFCVFTLNDGIATAGQGALVGSLQLMGRMSESFKMAGHLSSYMLVRAKELLHRGVLSGHCLLLQLWEACTIALSLSLYLINTVVNMLLLGAQSCCSAVVWAWETACGPVQKAAELTLALLTFLYSGLLGTAILLWTPCQLILEFLCSLSHVFLSIFLLNIYGLALTTAIVAAATLYLNADLPRHTVHRAFGYISSMPALCRLHRALCHLYPLAVERAQTTLEMGMWLWSGGGPGGPAEGHNGVDSNDTRPPAPSTPGGRNRQDGMAAALPDIPLAGCSVQEDSHPADSLLNLLKEQEERKKCVICQDNCKTVLLLPCRHLCLCRDCTNLLLHQPVYRHNCPLCRHMILQTMDVYL